MVDIVIPTVRRMAWLSTTLSSLLTQTQLRKVGRIFVIDDSETLDKEGLFRVFQKAFKLQGVDLVLMRGQGDSFYEFKPNFYWLIKRDLTPGISHLLYLDDDMVLLPDFVEKLIPNRQDIVSGFMLVLEDSGLTEEDVLVGNGQDWLLTGMAMYSIRLLESSKYYNLSVRYDKRTEKRFKDWGFLMNAIDKEGFSCKVEVGAKGWHLGVDSHFANWDRDIVEWRKGVR